jgi:hypothetical protein
MEKKEELLRNYILNGEVLTDKGWEHNINRCGFVKGKKFIGDEEIAKERGVYTCQVCGDVGEDRRTIYVSCFYALEEVSDKFAITEDNQYKLRVCKGCRAIFMDMLGNFVEGKGCKGVDGLDSDGIFAINVSKLKQ